MDAGFRPRIRDLILARGEWPGRRSRREDRQLFHRTDSVDEAFKIVTQHLIEHALAERGAFL